MRGLKALRAAVGVLAVLALDAQQALAGQTLARDGAVIISAHDGDEPWCGSTAHVEITSPDAGVFSADDPRFSRLAALLQNALSFECPDARAVDVRGVVGGETVYRGAAAALEGWRLQQANSTLRDNQGSVPDHWIGRIDAVTERVSARGVDRRNDQVSAAFYPQTDGQVRLRLGHCEGRLTVLTDRRQITDSTPQVGPSERLFRILQPVHPFATPENLRPLPECGNSGAPMWVVVRTNADRSLHLRFISHDVRGRSLRETVVVQRGEGDIPAVWPSAGTVARSEGGGNYSGYGAAVLLGLLLVAGALSFGSGGGGGYSSSGSAQQGRNPDWDEPRQPAYTPPAYTPPPPTPPINSFYAEPCWGC